ncbi:unnamed protein product [Rotaria socialis]|uniref:Transposase n=1 Tax=Rotaria socialis TaxID=392032 RepID=A0A821DDI9_9BILA|nr:unnamed protein product [Rotaria socialis]
MRSYKQVQLPDKEINLVKDLTCKWLCQDMRPFSIVEDVGLKNLLQQFISLGATYGEIDLKSIFRGADVYAKHIYKLADDYRAILKNLLQEPYENGCVCISPDLWTDPYKQISYLGISISFVDKEYIYKSFDLCCEPYTQVDHTGENILLAIRQCLAPFGLIDFNKLNFVSDRGPNLVSALKKYNTLYCYPHRVNNVLKCSFYQSQSKQEQITISAATDQHKSSINTANSTDVADTINDEVNRSPLSTDSENDKNESTLPIKNKTTHRKQSVTTTNVVVDPRKLKFKDLHPSAQEIIKIIVRCKNLVQFVKKSGCNKDIQSLGGVALQQSTVIRWLSLIELLESITSSFKETKRVLINRKQQSKLNGIDEKILKQLIRLLKPFKHVLKIIQTTNTPSLHMVLVCTRMLKDKLSSFEELLKYEAQSSTKDLDNSEEVEEVEEVLENEGIEILRLRILDLLNVMFTLDIHHYVATLLHPKYRQLKGCTSNEREQAYKYIRKHIHTTVKQNEQQQDDFEPSGSEDYSFKAPKADELDRYLAMTVVKANLIDNPLKFWESNQRPFPMLSKLARQIHCIPASSAGVERQFSGAGIVVNERRTALDPNQVNNILFIRSMENMKLAK